MKRNLFPYKSNPALVLEYRRVLADLTRIKLLGGTDQWRERYLDKIKNELKFRHLEATE